jgi:hypothetical protein
MIQDMIDSAFASLMSASNLPSIKNAAMKAKEVHWEMSNRMRISAGLARARIVNRADKTFEVLNCKVQFSSALFARMTDEEKFNTVSHEFAHVVEYYARGTSDHGMLFQQIHRQMGGSGNRCHKIDTTGLRNNRKRVKLFDRGTNKEYILTPKKAHYYANALPERFVIVGEFVLTAANTIA